MGKVVVIAGSGRSGTTWIQDVIAQANGMRTLFEPLNPIGVPKAEPFAFRFIPAAADEPDLKAFMDTVFSGHMKSLWAQYRILPERFNICRHGIKKTVYNTRRLFRHYRRYYMCSDNGIIVKFIRANLMLHWIVNTYKIPVLYVVRHPCSIIASRLKLKSPEWRYKTEISRYRKDVILQDTLLNKVNLDLEQPMSQASGLACVWCIENILPIRWAKENHYDMINYEILLADPEHEWSRVVKALKLDNIPSSDLVEIPSQQVSQEMRGKKFDDSHLGKWKKDLSDVQIKDIEDILKKFGLTLYSVDDPMPKLNSSDKWNYIRG
jgi:hypothetical protein